MNDTVLDIVYQKYLYNMSFRSEARNHNDRKKIQDISRWSI
jgi:hypothetical protein